jgi:hypothetical protein
MIYHGSRRREGKCLQDPSISSYFPFSLSLSRFFRPFFSYLSRHGKEVGREQWVGCKDVGVHKGDRHLRPLWHRWSTS